ncbi:MAG: hypothetical protein EOP02_22570 [Proteobacteria bacterium]|nr:MAG: hypothetical protein EOP02_22570 [Pseudomonadota bacterium]
MQPTNTTDVRTRLASILAGNGSSLDIRGLPAEEVLTCSRAEGVSALLASRMEPNGGTANGMHAELHRFARSLAASELAQRAELRRVLTALARAGIPVLVLKGHALGQWLYPAPYLRECSDIDLMFADRAQAEDAASTLDALGYATPYRPGQHSHEMLCRRQGAQVDLDIHWALAAMPAWNRLPGFHRLFADAVHLPGLGDSAKGLDPAHALLHACVHRASNLGAGLGDRLKWLYDIHLLATGFTGEQWGVFLRACHDARISGLALSGLHASRAMLATSLPVHSLEHLERDAVHDALDATRLADWRYVQRRNLAALDGLEAQARWLWGQVFPATGYMRELYGSQQSWSGLMLQRVKRLRARLMSRAD